MKKFNKIGLFSLLFSTILMLSITSCEKDDDVTPDNNGQEVESAILHLYDKNSPSGERVFYMEVSEKLPSSLDVSKAVEIGANSTAFSVGEHPFTWNGNAKTITKWNVNKNTLEMAPTALMSLAGTGVKNPRHITKSLQEAYVLDLKEGVLVEWNPNTMEIIQNHQIETPQVDENKFWSWNLRSQLVNDKYIISIGMEQKACCTFEETGGSLVAIFDPETKSVTYDQDNRLLSDYGYFVPSTSGEFYLQPNRGNSFVEPYFNGVPNDFSPFNILKLSSDGSIDPNFSFDLSSALPIEMFMNAAFVDDNKMVLSYVDTSSLDWPQSFDDVYNSDYYTAKTVAVDMVTGEETAIPELSKYDYVDPVQFDDGDLYIVGGIYGDIFTVDLIKVNSVNDFSVILTNKGGGLARYIGKLW